MAHAIHGMCTWGRLVDMPSLLRDINIYIYIYSHGVFVHNTDMFSHVAIDIVMSSNFIPHNGVDMIATRRSQMVCPSSAAWGHSDVTPAITIILVTVFHGTNSTVMATLWLCLWHDTRATNCKHVNHSYFIRYKLYRQKLSGLWLCKRRVPPYFEKTKALSYCETSK